MAFGFEMPIQSLLRSLSVVFGSEICCLSFGAAFVVLCFFAAAIVRAELLLRRTRSNKSRR